MVCTVGLRRSPVASFRGSDFATPASLARASHLVDPTHRNRSTIEERIVFIPHCVPVYGKKSTHKRDRYQVIIGKRENTMQRHASESPKYGIACMSARTVLGENIKALMANSTTIKTTVALEKATQRKGCKVGKSTIDRAIKGTTTLNVDYIEAIASVFGLDTWQILTPSMQPQTPPVLRTTGEAEDAMYKKLKGLASEIAALEIHNLNG